ncbi:MAG TPA: four helix bundle protein [Melioribacteraceae bacterium]|nr:four helix bundle protein [Melioribacteraceae bacterium]
MENVISFKNLTVWQKALSWSCNIILLIDSLNTDRKHFRLFEQIESSAASVPMNISEGNGRFSKKEYLHFLYIARGSAFETITLLNLFCQMKWIDVQKLNDLENEGTEIVKMINGLIKSLKSKP